MLDPQARALIDLMIEKGVPPTHTMTPAQARSFYRDRRGFTQPEPPAPRLPRQHCTLRWGKEGGGGVGMKGGILVDAAAALCQVPTVGMQAGRQESERVSLVGTKVGC